MKYHKKQKTKKVYVVFLSLIIVAAVSAFIYAYSNSTWPFLRNELSDNTNIDNLTNQPDREQAETGQTPSEIVDTGGKDASGDISNGKSSESGSIVLISPSNDQLLKKGSIISGTSATDFVVYEIADSGRGMISSGRMSVVDGKFSAKINDLNPSSKEGSLRVFSVDDNTLREYDHININVVFEL